MTNLIDNIDGISRRDFLKAGAVAAGAVAVVSDVRADNPAALPGAGAAGRRTDPVKAPVRLGVAGGHFGAQLYWHEHPQCDVRAVTDLIPERLAYMKEVYGCERGYASLEEMVKDPELDAIAVFTGATDLVRHCLLCFEHGKHVAAASPAAMTLEGARQLRDGVRKSGLLYFMAETSYYHQSVISARKWHGEGKFGNIFCCEAEYHHPGLETLFVDDAGKRTWRYGLPPMLYSTHCTGQLMAVTGERLTEVTCHGWGDDSPILKDNAFNNPYWGETAFFKTDKGNTLRAAVYWRGALANTERAIWLGEKMSFYAPHPNGEGPIIRRSDEVVKAAQDSGERLARYEKHDQKLWWQTDILPEPLRHISGHDGSHTFLTHEFIDALVKGRPPSMGVDLALNMAIPGIMAHQSAMQGGKTLAVPSVDEL